MQAIIRQSLYSEESERRILEKSSRLFCDALVLVTHGISLEEARRLSRGHVLILVDELSNQDEYCTVNTPSYEGARAAMARLLDCGVRHPVVIGAERDLMNSGAVERRPDLVVGRLRLDGVRDALRSRGMELTETMCVPSDWTYEHARSAVCARFADMPCCDGMFALFDAAAIGAIRGLADMGIEVPEDVRVIGFDGASISAFTTPSLSTVDVDMGSMADMIVSRLLTGLTQGVSETLDDDEAHNGNGAVDNGITHDVVPFTLRLRESTGD